ncbi:hypothetical protein KR505_17110 [Eubacterium callanderi]|nr:hypothetical protein [Eubacterium limosum]MBV1685115.1 hypothetical protein [Eubacterium callanderi]MCB6657616.1 hypothetical protein [Eubacterium callanderi]MCB6751101.1 hypothetical protein [Eubacterium callanderi]MCB7102716.1 hypothetical protein [Eubacterium callanderi]
MYRVCSFDSTPSFDDSIIVLHNNPRKPADSTGPFGVFPFGRHSSYPVVILAVTL